MIPGCLEAVWRAGTAGRQTLEWVTAVGLEALAADAVGTLSHLDIFPPTPLVMARLGLGKLRARVGGR